MPRDTAFFREIKQFEGKEIGFKFPMPIFYYDLSAFFAVYTASYAGVARLLPSPRLKPYRLLRKRAPVFFVAFSYRDTDIGAYNEFGVAVPVNLDDSLPGAALIRGLAHPTMFITHLPVTTEIALVAGKEVYNFPKFIADINFEQGEKETAAILSDSDQHILTLTIPALRGRRNLRLPMNILTCRSGNILRCEVISDVHEVAFATGLRGVKLSLGQNHFMARDLKSIGLGKPLAVAYIPKAQMILTNPLESQPVMK